MRTPLTRKLAATLGAIALISVACGSSGSPDSASPVTIGEAVANDPATAPEAVMVPTASGGQLDFNSLRGQDVLLWFWAPW